MAAISTTLWAYARPGTAILHSDPIYGGTDFLLKKILPQFGVYPVAFSTEGGVEAMQIAAEKARKLGSVAAIYVETPANPTNGIVDIAAARVLAEHLATDGRRLPLIVDNTFLGPIYQTLRWRLEPISLSLRSRNMSVAIPISSRVGVRDQRQCCNRFAACEQF
jgi:methionine-gamma-lyase